VRAWADTHPVFFSAVVAGVLFFIFTFAIWRFMVPSLPGVGRPGGGAVLRTALIGAVVFGLLTFLLQRAIYSTP
jgi:hypothetical protein